MRSRGVGANAAVPSACSLRQAVAGLGTVPRTGLHVSVSTLGAVVGVARYVIRRSMAPVLMAVEAVADTAAAARATSATRAVRGKVHPGYAARLAAWL